MTEKLMVYVFLRSRLVIDPTNPLRGQHFTAAHYSSVPVEEINDPDFVLIDRYGFDTLPSEVIERMTAEGFDVQLSWHVSEVFMPSIEEFAEIVANLSEQPEEKETTTTAEAASQIPIACPPVVDETAEAQQADRAASAVIMGEANSPNSTEGKLYAS